MRGIHDDQAHRRRYRTHVERLDRREATSSKETVGPGAPYLCPVAVIHAEGGVWRWAIATPWSPWVRVAVPTIASLRTKTA